MTRSVALVLTLITGFSALVYQVAWQKFLAILLGSHVEATAVVLGIFLGGLSYGYALFGRITHRLVESSPGAGAVRRLLQVYGAVEAGIGIWALVFPVLFAGVRAVSLWVPRGSEGLSFTVDVLLAAVLIGPPAVMMGGTIPLLTQALPTSLADATRFHAFVYAFNTAGAFFGALCAGFFLVPRLGLQGVVLAMGLVNVAAGSAFLLLALRHRGLVARRRDESNESTVSPGVLISYVAVALLGGFAMMAIQTVVNRIAALSLGAAPFTFSMVVATFVLCIAIGSFVVSALPRIHRAVLPVSQWILVSFLLLLYPAIGDSPYWAHVVRSVFRDHPALAYPFYFTVFLGLLAVLLIPLALAGAALPLIFHHLRREFGDLGGVAGRLYSWNTVGSLAGALLGGYALLFWLDLHHVYRLALLALAAAAAILTLRGFAHGRLAAIAAFVLSAVVLVALPVWPHEKLSSGTFRARAPLASTYAGPKAFWAEYLSEFSGDDFVAFYEDGPAASVAVLETGESSRAIILNGKPDSDLPGDEVTTGLLALLPALLAEKCERAFVIGFGTGLTVGELASLDSVREVVVAEISHGVIRAAPIFENLNRRAATNPKTRIIRSDAYRALLRSEGGFDVISSEPSNPWVAGVEMLYSLEFLRAARERLSPGGAYAQWFHTYELDEESLALVLETYRTAFDRVAVWRGKGPDLFLLGFRDGGQQIDLGSVERRWALDDYQAAFRRLGIESLPALLVHELMPLGVLHEIELTASVHTLLRPTLNHKAALAFFSGRNARIPASVGRRATTVGARNSLLRQYRMTRGGTLGDEDWLEIVEEACTLSSRHCATFFARWLHERPDSSALREVLARARTQGRSSQLSSNHLLRLASLFGEDSMPGVEPTYEFARRVLEIFSGYYHHAVPFHPAALHGPWLRCARDPRCSAQRARILEIGLDPGDVPQL